MDAGKRNKSLTNDNVRDKLIAFLQDEMGYSIDKLSVHTTLSVNSVELMELRVSCQRSYMPESKIVYPSKGTE